MTREDVKRWVEAEGLLFLGVAPLEYEADYARFSRWLEEGRHAGLGYLERYRELRRRPEGLLPGARAAVVFALPHDLGDPWEADHPPRAAQYARFRDYHRLLRDRGERIGQKLGGRFRVVVDSAPVLERALAARTGEGFVGKNTCFIHPHHGSFLLLGEILTDRLPAEGGEPFDSTRRTAEGGCGTCALCQVHCPTGALSRDYSIDTEKCLAYWTIEHRGPIPETFWPHLGKYWFGCDLCQLVCPYNRRRAGRHLPPDLAVREIPPLPEVALMDQRQYETWFGGTPMTRPRREGLKRNALIALVVTGDPRLGEVMDRLERDPTPPLPETLAQAREWLRLAGRPEGRPTTGIG